MAARTARRIPGPDGPPPSFWGNFAPLLHLSLQGQPRTANAVEPHRAGFAGILQVDGYAAYSRLARDGNRREAGHRYTPRKRAMAIQRLAHPA
jgi:hypothetical protein